MIGIELLSSSVLPTAVSWIKVYDHWHHAFSVIVQQGPGGSEDDYIPVSDLANSSMQQHEVEEVEAFWDANPQLDKLSTWAVSMPCRQPLWHMLRFARATKVPEPGLKVLRIL